MLVRHSKFPKFILYPPIVDCRDWELMLSELVSHFVWYGLVTYWRFGDGLVSWRVRLGLRLVGRLVLTCFELLETGTNFDSIPAGRFLLQVEQLWLRRSWVLGLRLGLGFSSWVLGLGLGLGFGLGLGLGTVGA